MRCGARTIADRRLRLVRMGIGVGLLVLASVCSGVTIPAPQRVPARVVAALAAPAGNELDMPTDVAVGPAGRIYVADGVKGRVVVLNRDGSFAGAITVAGQVTLVRPVGLTVDAQHRLWIADPGLHRVLAVSTAVEGPPGTPSLLMNLEPPPLRRGPSLEPADPTDAAVSADGSQIFIVDDLHHRLIAYDTQTRAMQVIGGPGRGLGQFEYPFSISLGPDGSVFVCEAIGARVQRIAPSGRPGGQIGRWGVETGAFYRPKGLVVRDDGFVFVGDSSLGVVQAFRTDGAFVGVLTEADGRPLSLKHPMGLALDAQGRLLVTELTANRVAVVDVSGLATAARAGATRPATPAADGRAAP